MVHSKVILVDPFGADPVVLTGSHNLGPKASGTNDENLLIIRDAPASPPPTPPTSWPSTTSTDGASAATPSPRPALERPGRRRRLATGLLEARG